MTTSKMNDFKFKDSFYDDTKHVYKLKRMQHLLTPFESWAYVGCNFDT